ncbi:MAG: hypothetical protein ACLFNZ_00930 [Spirochaetaceae bacterium]
MRKLFFFFIDGIGLGEDDPEINPLCSFLSPFLGSTHFTSNNVPRRGENFILLPADACLGVEGTPKSATGQTSIMTGVNASRLLGYHMQAFPNNSLIELLQRENLFLSLKEKGISSTCANLYSHEFLEERKNKRKNMLPVSTLSLESAGIPLRFIQDYREGKALFADITNRFLRARGYNLPILSPGEGAERIVGLLREYQFVFFEYFLTDSYGHTMEFRRIEKEVDKLNEFLARLQQAVNNEDDPVDILITSDHGNAEDNRTADHTRNPVPFFFASRSISSFTYFEGEVKSLTDIKQAILSYFDK